MANLGPQFIPIPGTAQQPQQATPPAAVFLQGMTGAMNGRRELEARQAKAKQQQFDNRMSQGQLGVQEGTLGENITQNDEINRLKQEQMTATFVGQAVQAGYGKPATGATGEMPLGNWNGIDYVYRDKPKTASTLISENKLRDEKMFNKTFRTPLIRQIRKDYMKAKNDESMMSGQVEGFDPKTPPWDVYVQNSLQQYGTTLEAEEAMADAQDKKQQKNIFTPGDKEVDNIFAGIEGLD